MNIKKITWKLFSIKAEELKFVIPLFLLYLLSGIFYTVGQIYTESIFITTYGAAGFSKFFIVNSFVLIITGTLYNSFFLKIKLKTGYIILIGFSFTIILFSIFLLNKNLKQLAFYMYMTNYLFTFFLDIHFFNYSFKFLSLRNAKRILPFLMGAGKLGGIFSSLFIFSFLNKISPLNIATIWASSAIIMVLPIYLLRKIEPKNQNNKESEKHLFLEKFIQKAKNSTSIPIFKYSVIAIFLMSIVNQISEYYFALSFKNAFPTREKLTSFLSIYTFSSDLITFIIQITLTSKIIKKLGVQKSNLIYPTAFISFLSFFIISPGFIAGIFLRFYRKNLSLIIRTPIFNIIMASSPKEKMAEVKSFISGIISPLGMLTGGLAIHFIANFFSTNQGYLFSGLIGIAYIYFVIKQNKSYLKTLRNRLSYNFTERYKDIKIPEIDKITNENFIFKNIKIFENLFNENPSTKLLYYLHAKYENLENKTKINILYYLYDHPSIFFETIIKKATNDSDPIIRGISLYSLKEKNFKTKTKLLSSKNKFNNDYEKIALSIFLSKNSKNAYYKYESFIKKIKNEIILGKRETSHFIALFNSVSSFFILNDLVELALSTKDEIYLRLIIPFSTHLKRTTIKKIISSYKESNIELLISLISLSNNFLDSDRTIFLNIFKNISEENMITIFRYNHTKISENLFEKLFQNKSFYKKQNYLNFLIATNYKSQNKIIGFIKYQIKSIEEIDKTIEMLTCVNKNETLINFIILTLKDSIELNKNLILKAISLLTGVKLDKIYESNLLLKNSEINNIILEFIESTNHNITNLIQIFDNHIKKSNYKTKQINKLNTLKKASHYINSFISEIKIPESIQSNNFKIVSQEGKSKMDIFEKIIQLKKSTLFNQIKTYELLQIAKITNEIKITENSYLIKEGEIGEKLFIIINGEVEVFTNKNYISNLSDGDCIGELSIIDAEPRSSNVKTITNCELLTIKKDDFLIMLKENPIISINVMRIITRRLREHIAK